MARTKGILLADVIEGWDSYCEKMGIHFGSCNKVAYKNMGHAFQAGVRLGVRLERKRARAERKPKEAGR